MEETRSPQGRPYTPPAPPIKPMPPKYGPVTWFNQRGSLEAWEGGKSDAEGVVEQIKSRGGKAWLQTSKHHGYRVQYQLPERVSITDIMEPNREEGTGVDITVGYLIEEARRLREQQYKETAPGAMTDSQLQAYREFYGKNGRAPNTQEWADINQNLEAERRLTGEVDPDLTAFYQQYNRYPTADELIAWIKAEDVQQRYIPEEPPTISQPTDDEILEARHQISTGDTVEARHPEIITPTTSLAERQGVAPTIQEKRTPSTLTIDPNDTREEQERKVKEYLRTKYGYTPTPGEVDRILSGQEISISQFPQVTEAPEKTFFQQSKSDILDRVYEKFPGTRPTEFTESEKKGILLATTIATGGLSGGVGLGTLAAGGLAVVEPERYQTGLIEGGKAGIILKTVQRIPRVGSPLAIAGTVGLGALGVVTATKEAATGGDLLGLAAEGAGAGLAFSRTGPELPAFSKTEMERSLRIIGDIRAREQPFGYTTREGFVKEGAIDLGRYSRERPGQFSITERIQAGFGRPPLKSITEATEFSLRSRQRIAETPQVSILGEGTTAVLEGGLEREPFGYTTREGFVKRGTQYKEVKPRTEEINIPFDVVLEKAEGSRFERLETLGEGRLLRETTYPRTEGGLTGTVKDISIIEKGVEGGVISREILDVGVDISQKPGVFFKARSGGIALTQVKPKRATGKIELGGTPLYRYTQPPRAKFPVPIFDTETETEQRGLVLQEGAQVLGGRERGGLILAGEEITIPTEEETIRIDTKPRPEEIPEEIIISSEETAQTPTQRLQLEGAEVTLDTFQIGRPTGGIVLPGAQERPRRKRATDAYEYLLYYPGTGWVPGNHAPFMNYYAALRTGGSVTLNSPATRFKVVKIRTSDPVTDNVPFGTQSWEQLKPYFNKARDGWEKKQQSSPGIQIGGVPTIRIGGPRRTKGKLKLGGTTNNRLRI